MILNMMYSKQSAPSFDYGDGTYNTVQRGYNNHIRVYKGSTYQDVGIASGAYSTCGNFQVGIDESALQFTDAYTSGVSGNTGYNNLSVGYTAPNGDATICLEWVYSAITTGIYLGEVEICVDGSWYGLNQAFVNDAIKPLILVVTGYNNGTSYYFPQSWYIPNYQNCGSGNYPTLKIYFTLPQGKRLDYVYFYANKAGSSSYGEGLRVHAIPANEFRITYK